MKVGDFCNRTVVVANVNDSVALGAKLMRVHHVGCIVIVEGPAGGRVPIGIVTDRDIVVSVVAEGRDASSTNLGDAMTAGLYCALDQQELEHVVGEMRARGLRRVPVVDEHGQLQGIFTFDDLVEWSSEQMLELSRLVQREQQREQSGTARPSALPNNG